MNNSGLWNTNNSNNKLNYMYNVMIFTITSLYNNQDIMKADSGASKIYLQSKHVTYLLNPEILLQ